MEKQLTIVNFVQVKMLSTFPSLDLALALSCFSNQMPSFPCITNLVPVYNSQENRASITPVQKYILFDSVRGGRAVHVVRYGR